MATSLTSQITAIIAGTMTDDLDLSDPEDALSYTVTDSMANGTAAEQANERWHDRRTLAATSENLDLAGGLTNWKGETITFTKIKTIFIYNRAPTTGYNLTVGAAGAAPFVNWVGGATHTMIIGPEGFDFRHSPIDGYAVTAGTGDILKIDSGANAITYDIILIGTD